MIKGDVNEAHQTTEPCEIWCFERLYNLSSSAGPVQPGCSVYLQDKNIFPFSLPPTVTLDFAPSVSEAF